MCCRGSRVIFRRASRGTTRGSWRPGVCGSKGTRRAVALSIFVVVFSVHRY
jgi:hypothetical protein